MFFFSCTDAIYKFRNLCCRHPHPPISQRRRSAFIVAFCTDVFPTMGSDLEPQNPHHHTVDTVWGFFWWRTLKKVWIFGFLIPRHQIPSVRRCQTAPQSYPKNHLHYISHAALCMCQFLTTFERHPMVATFTSQSRTDQGKPERT